MCLHPSCENGQRQTGNLTSKRMFYFWSVTQGNYWGMKKGCCGKTTLEKPSNHKFKRRKITEKSSIDNFCRLRAFGRHLRGTHRKENCLSRMFFPFWRSRSTLKTTNCKRFIWKNSQSLKTWPELIITLANLIFRMQRLSNVLREEARKKTNTLWLLL